MSPPETAATTKSLSSEIRTEGLVKTFGSRTVVDGVEPAHWRG